MNLAIILTAAAGAYILEKVCAFIDNRMALKEYHEGKFYQKKLQRLHDSAFYYYYDLMMTNPTALSYELASQDINRLKREKRIDAMYQKLAR